MQLELDFDSGCSIAGFDVTDINVLVTPDPAPNGFALSELLTTSSTATLVFNQPFPAGNWTCVSHAIGGDLVCNGVLPGDSDANLMSNSDAVIHLTLSLITQQGQSPAHATDVNRSGTTDAEDIIHEINLLIGAGA